jgi:hypothetical protein
MEFRGITFTVVITNTGLTVRAVGDAPDPPLTQAEIYDVVRLLNNGEAIELDADGVTTGATWLVDRVMVESALRNEQPEPEEELP